MEEPYTSSDVGDLLLEMVVVGDDALYNLTVRVPVSVPPNAIPEGKPYPEDKSSVQVGVLKSVFVVHLSFR